MKANTPAAQQLIALLDSTPEGAAISLPALIPAMSDQEVQAFLVEKEERHWTLACYWHGISIGDVQASLSGDTLVLEDV